MLDMKEDTFFDDNKNDGSDSNELLAMINTLDKKLNLNIKPGDKVTGIITSIGSDDYFVDIQAKNEAILKKSDFDSEKKIGDSITGYVISITDSEINLSTKISAQKQGKQSLFNAFNNKIPVQGKVSAVSKDGLTVSIFGSRAFCPISQVDINFTEDINVYLGKSFDFIISRISEGGKNIILSRIPLLEENYTETINDLSQNIEKRTIYSGIIKKITSFGLFIEINGIEGLAHISELSWEHIINPSDCFSVGHQVSCIVLNVDIKKPIKKSKISLSIKQVQENPWNSISSTLSIGQSIAGKVARLTNFGAFIELFPGVDGLLHVSEMSWVKKVRHPSDILTVGDQVNVTILSIDTNKKSISLTLKDLSNDPWNNIETDFSSGKEVSGTIVKKSRYGYFIDLKEGVTGLLVYSNINLENKELFKDGETIPVTILTIDKENRRISLAYGTPAEELSNQIVKEYNQAKQGNSSRSATDFGSALLNALSKKDKK